MLKPLRCERGQDLIEYALVLPVLLLLLFGIVQFALIMFSYNTISDAAREAARFGVIVDASGYRSEAAIEAQAYEVTDAAGLNRARVAANAAIDTTTKQIQVEVTYQMNMVTAFLGLPDITLRAVSTKRIEVE